MHPACKWCSACVSKVLAVINRSANARFNHGFTLIELIVTIAIASILMLVAVPNFIAYQRNSQLTSTVNTFVASLNAARGEAMKRGVNSFVVPTNNGGDWTTGWLAFADVDRNRVFTSEAADALISSQAAVPDGIAVTGNGSASGTAPYLMFDASGYSKLKNGSFGALALRFQRTDVTGTVQLAQTRILVVASTGRVRVCTPVSATDTNCRLNIDTVTGQ